MKTIREVSENIGISKVSLYRLIKKPELKNHVKKDNNTTFIDDIAEQIIVEYYNRQRLTTLNDILDESTEKAEELAENDGVNQVNKHGLQGVNQVNKHGLQGVNQVKSVDFMRILETQLDVKDKQLEEKDRQIKIKDEQIKQKDNQLNALLILLNKQKDIALINDSVVDKTDTAQSKPSKGFFKRIFRKKKHTSKK